MSNNLRAVGIDISLWQDINSTPQMCDFNQARRAGASFAFIKVSQANWADPDFAMNWHNAKQAGMPRGGYHFMTWDVSVGEQARFFAGMLKRDPGDLPPVLDYEMRKLAPDKFTAASYAKIFMMEVEQILGIKPILYTSPGFWAEFGSNDPFWRDYILWIAHYYVNAPIVPAPWKAWTFWQHSAGKGQGSTYGAESNDIDLNVFNGTEQQLLERFKLGAPGQPQPGPEPDPLGSSLCMRVAVDGLFIRKGPGIQYPSVGQLDRNQVVEVFSARGKDAWAQIDPIDDLWCCSEKDGKRYLLPYQE